MTAGMARRSPDCALAKGLKQSAIEGLSERPVRRIEKGKETTFEALQRLAAAQRMDHLPELAIECSAGPRQPAGAAVAIRHGFPVLLTRVCPTAP